MAQMASPGIALRQNLNLLYIGGASGQAGGCSSDVLPCLGRLPLGCSTKAAPGSNHPVQCTAFQSPAASLGISQLVYAALGTPRVHPQSSPGMPRVPPHWSRGGECGIRRTTGAPRTAQVPTASRAHAATVGSQFEITDVAVSFSGTPDLLHPELRLDTLEPYFYYMGRKWGLKAYGVEFKEFLREEGEISLRGDEEEADEREGTGGPSSAAVLMSASPVVEGELLKGVGVYAAQDIDAIDAPKIVMEIPLPLMVTVSRDHPWMFYPNIVPIGHPIFDVINDTDPEEDWDLRLACLLLWAMGQGGAGRRHVEQKVEAFQMPGLQTGPHFLTEYCDFLPPLDDCPALLMASQEDLEELQDAELAESVRAEQEKAAQFWERHWGEAANPPSSLARLAPSKRHFIWAVAQAKHRGVLQHAPMGVLDQDGHMLIPYADMVNHSFTPNCCLFWRKIDRVMEVRVMRGQKIVAGEELTLDYLSRGATNRELMLSHSFSMTKNPFERVHFSGLHRIHRDSFLSAFDVVGYEGQYEFTEPMDDAEPDPFQDEAVIAATRCVPMWSDGAVPCLPSEEIRAAKGLQQECLDMLRTLPTDLNDDLGLLKEQSQERSAAWNLALKYRIDRKLFLIRLVDALEVYMERLIV